MAAKEPPDKKANSGGLLGWLRGGKQAEETGRVPVVKVEPSQPNPVTTGADNLQRDVSLRHVDKGEIARGGMGSIRKVYDTNLNRTVAMKVLFPEHRTDQKISARFAEEAQIMGQLEHPNIVPVHDFGEDHEGTRYITMYYVRGKTLTEILQSDTTADGSREAFFRLLNIFVRVCDAVAFAHSRGVIHRDLKPDNIMVGSFGEVYLMDWGIARLVGRTSATPSSFAGGDVPEPVTIRRDARSGLTPDDETGQIIGTFFYMSPEQALAQIEKIDERTDVFLLGGVLYEILTGQPPYMGSTVVEVVRAAQAGRIPPPEMLSPDRPIPPALSRIAMKCLAKDQKDRYPSVLAVKAEVETFLKGGASFPIRTFKGGEHLMNEGELGDEVFIITKGQVQVYKTFADGRKQGLATLGPGAVVGEAAVFSSSARTASVVAIEDVIATAVTRAQLERELGINSWMGSLVKTLADRFIGVDEKLQKTTTQLHATQVEAWTLGYLMSHGATGPSGHREAPLSAMLKQAKRALLKPEPELRGILEKSKQLKIDAARDAIYYVPQ